MGSTAASLYGMGCLPAASCVFCGVIVYWILIAWTDGLIVAAFFGALLSPIYGMLLLERLLPQLERLFPRVRFFNHKFWNDGWRFGLAIGGLSILGALWVFIPREFTREFMPYPVPVIVLFAAIVLLFVLPDPPLE